MKTNVDFNSYDCLPTALKKNTSEELVNLYRIFRWEEAERTEDKRFSDIVNITFIRPHKIPNKDRLQLLQVMAEERINSIAIMNTNKYSRSTALSLTAGIITFGAFLGGIGIALTSSFIMLKVMGGILSVIALAFSGLLISMIPKMRLREDISYATESQRLHSEIDRICDEAKSLKEVL